MTDAYAELHCHSYFSLLDAASSPESLVTRAKELNLSDAKRPLRFSEPFVLIIALEFALDERLQSGTQLFETFTDAFVICDGHKLFLVELGFPLAQDSHHSVKFRLPAKEHLLHLRVVVPHCFQSLLRWNNSQCAFGCLAISCP